MFQCRSKMSLSMLCSRINRKHLFKLNKNVSVLCGRYRSTEAEMATVNEQDETKPNATEAAIYPEILDLSVKECRKREKIAWHEEVKKLNTIEEKLIKVNMPKYYGWQMMMLTDQDFPYNTLPYVQHYTRTQFETGLPAEWCKYSAEQLDAIVISIKDQIEEAILFHKQGYRREYEFGDELSETEKNRENTLRICTEINRVLLNALTPTVPHLNETEIDMEPRHEAFWFVGGIQPICLVQNIRKGNKMSEEDIKEPIDRPFQYEGKPLLALRNRLPLEAVVDDPSAPIFTTENLPANECDPRTIGWFHDYQHGRTIPGFWPGSEHQFGQLSYHDRSHFVNRNKNYGKDDELNTLHSQALLASYSWLLGQACYQGFSTYNDITYPLTTQTIITDGQHWSFYVYQLNTTTLNNVVYKTNPKVNKCWGTAEMKLYEEIDSNGKIIGLNTDVIRQLVEFYVAVPKKRNYDMAPYLDQNESTVADIEQLERRMFLERQFKHIYSKRPRYRLAPETYLWEKIYKIDHKTRPMDARRKFFEINVDPWARSLDDHQPVYIPKSLRPGGPKSKPKWETNYWP